MKNVLVIGSGGREAAIVKKLCQDPSIAHVFCSPGSAGILAISSKVGLFPGLKGVSDYGALQAYAKRQEVDLTIVGPEAPLVDGIVDVFNEAGLRIVGPSRAAAQIEGSKVFCKNLLRDNNIPTAAFEVFDDPDAAREHIQQHGAPIVVKADGLAAGKGVVVARTIEAALDAVDRIMLQHEFGEAAGHQVVIEDCLQGEECSVIALTDGAALIPLMPAQDYKPAFDNDKGPNTGGMGCYAPVPACDGCRWQDITERILRPTIEAMQRRGTPYRGALYAGLMLTADGPKVLEFNCRFGDPETQVLLELMNVDLLPLLEATVDGTLKTLAIEKMPVWPSKMAVCLVLAAQGYPGSYEKGLPIAGIEQAEEMGVSILHAGTARALQGDGWVTHGGRVLNLIAIGDTFREARDRVYRTAQGITFGGEKPHFRTDIALRACWSP